MKKTLTIAAALALAGCSAGTPPSPTPPPQIAQTQASGATAEQIAQAAKTGVIPETFTAQERRTVAWLRGSP